VKRGGHSPRWAAQPEKINNNNNWLLVAASKRHHQANIYKKKLKMLVHIVQNR
jgi:hypothetical protein